MGARLEEAKWIWKDGEFIAWRDATVHVLSLAVQFGVLALIAAGVTIGIYGLVAGIVKLDDLGMYLRDKEGSSRFTAMQRSFGLFILRMAPKLMKALSVLGTAAMFLVGGGILVHSFHSLGDWIAALGGHVEAIPGLGRYLAAVTPSLSSMAVR